MKNDGGLRLLKKTDADSLLLYDNRLRTYKSAGATEFQELQPETGKTGVLLHYYKIWKATINTPRVFSIYDNNRELLNR